MGTHQIPSAKGHSRPPPIFGRICCGQMAGWIKMPLGIGRYSLGPIDIVSSPPQKEGTARPPNFRPISIVAKRLNTSRCHYRPRPRLYCATWGPMLPPLKKGHSPHPQFSAHVYCGQTAKWIKMTLAMAVGLGPGHIVPDRPQKEGTAPAPIFDPCQLWPNG